LLCWRLIQLPPPPVSSLFPYTTLFRSLDLSRRRAEAVKSFLVAQGVAPQQVKTVGYGKTRLVVPGAWGDRAGAESNRRVVFVVETKGQAALALLQPDESR